MNIKLPNTKLLNTASAADQPQWGEKGTRNRVSNEKNIPTNFNPGRRDSRSGEIKSDSTENIRWTAVLGQYVYGTPIVAEGKVLIGTNESFTKRPEFEGDRGVLVCFDEKTGAFLWELICPKRLEIKYGDWYNVGITSSPAVENGNVYLLTNRAEVVCLDINGMQNGNGGPFIDEYNYFRGQNSNIVNSNSVNSNSDNSGTERPDLRDADILWKTDLVEELAVMPHNATNCSILIDGDVLYVCTGNGVDWRHQRVMNPTAPTLIALDKKTGRILARDSFGMGPNIIHGQWSSPALGVVDGGKMIFQGTGCGRLFAVEALSEKDVQRILADGKIRYFKTLWSFDGHPRRQRQETVSLVHTEQTNSFEVTANPVFYDNKLYVVFTQEVHHSMRQGWIVCLDVQQAIKKSTGFSVQSYSDQKTNSNQTANQSANQSENQSANQSANQTANQTANQSENQTKKMIEYKTETCSDKPMDDGRGTDLTNDSSVLLWAADLGSSDVTPAIKDDLLYIANTNGDFHCLDAQTGEEYWSAELGGEIWGSPLIVDGLVWVGSTRRVLQAFEHSEDGPNLKVRALFPSGIYSSITAANESLYVPMFGNIYAVGMNADENKTSDNKVIENKQ